MVKDVLERLSSYNLFNYLLPGVLFGALGQAISGMPLLYDDIVIGLFVYYFYGLVISRTGSIVVEPVLKSVGVLQFADYRDFVAASKVDSKIEILSESNNMYRTFCSLFLCLLILSLVTAVIQIAGITQKFALTVGVIGLLALFVLSYRKQTAYIKSRIEAAKGTRNVDAQQNVGEP